MNLSGLCVSDPVSFLRSRALSPAELRRLDKVDLELFERVLGSGVEVATEEDYGEELWQSPVPPSALFVWGKKRVMKSPMVAIVRDTRCVDIYGKAVAQKFGEALARAGVTAR